MHDELLQLAYTKLYDKLCAKADTLLKKHNPCNIFHDGKDRMMKENREVIPVNDWAYKYKFNQYNYESSGVFSTRGVVHYTPINCTLYRGILGLLFKHLVLCRCYSLSTTKKSYRFNGNHKYGQCPKK